MLQRAKARWLWLLAPLGGLSAAGSEELPQSEQVVEPCSAGQLSFVVHAGSRLLAQADSRLELRRGRALPCHHPLVEALRQPLLDAGRALPHAGLPQPLRVHVDPRLPAAEAPLGGVEVHVSSRELLVARAALPQLPADAWRHELLHSLAATPPPSSEVARRLWLTLEEGLVQHATQRSVSTTPARSAPTTPEAPGTAPWLPSPVWEQLALPAYDPHELAQAWAQELARLQPPLELHGAVTCLSAAPSARALHTLRQVAQAFVERCPPAVTPVLQQALQRWLPGEWQPPHVASVQPAAAVFSAQAR